MTELEYIKKRLYVCENVLLEVMKVHASHAPHINESFRIVSEQWDNATNNLEAQRAEK